MGSRFAFATNVTVYLYCIYFRYSNHFNTFSILHILSKMASASAAPTVNRTAFVASTPFRGGNSARGGRIQVTRQMMNAAAALAMDKATLMLGTTNASPTTLHPGILITMTILLRSYLQLSKYVFNTAFLYYNLR
jgi:hypothetical protein